MENEIKNEETVEEVNVDAEIDEAENKGKYTLKHPIKFEGQEIKTIDVESVRDIKWKDIQEARDYLKRIGKSPDLGMEMYDAPELAFAILTIKTKLPMEVIDELSSWDAIILHNMVRNFLAM